MNLEDVSQPESGQRSAAAASAIVSPPLSEVTLPGLKEHARRRRPAPRVRLVAPLNDDESRACLEISKTHKLSTLAARTLVSRGFEIGRKLTNYLAKDQAPLPEVKKLKGAAEGFELLRHALSAGERIGIMCDYDVDGTTSAAQFKVALGELGAKTKVYSPCRFTEGYGMSVAGVRKLHEWGAKTLVVLDIGTSNKDEILLARSLGMKVLVIDHHALSNPVPPPADVFINPHQRGGGLKKDALCTGGLTWLFLNGLREHLLAHGTESERAAANDLKTEALLGYAAMATDADAVPLLGGNRIISSRGHLRLSRAMSPGYANRPGIKELRDFAGINGRVESEDIQFKLGPLINAVGRLHSREVDGQSGGELAVELLTTRERARARELAEILHRYNERRKEIEQEVVRSVERELDAQAEVPPAIVVSSPSYHQGVVGLGAARLNERLNRFSVVLQELGDGRAKGSVRAPEGLNAIKILKSLRSHLLKFGGHAAAAGLSMLVEKIPAFREALCAAVTKELTGKLTSGEVKPHFEVTLGEYAEHGERFYRELEKLRPFGQKNPSPLLLMRDVRIVGAKLIKDRHLELQLKQGATYLSAKMWHVIDHPALAHCEVVGRAADGSDLLVVRPQAKHPVRIAFRAQLEGKRLHSEERRIPSVEIVAAEMEEEVV